jgi:arylsulfatase A-like enzyme
MKKRAIMVMFDSLNRHMLPPYGNSHVIAPNFQRLAECSVTFDQCWIGSMPCMPARRELHTGRYNFLHRAWGPLEPYDDSMPELLKENGVYTHLITDHQHYFEDGGGTYHGRYNTYEFNRGQEGDAWKGQVDDPQRPQHVGVRRENPLMRQDWINRQYIQEEFEFPQARTFEQGLAFMETNNESDRWFLQIETFDPHEPFYAPERYKELYPHGYDGPHFDWPPYGRVEETADEVQHVRYEYAALVSMCDHYLGRVLDTMDRLDMWKDTLLIVNTDHGYLLGEHDWWAKTVQPFYNEIARIPLFIWDPRCGKRGERRDSLAQTIDLPVTLLEYFGVAVPADMQGQSLSAVIAGERSDRKGVLFGIFGGHVNCTDGRYVYMKAPVRADNRPLYNYGLMPCHMRSMFGLEELQSAELSTPLPFTKGVPVLRTHARSMTDAFPFGDLLFDLEVDPGQQAPINDPAIIERMTLLLLRLMKESDAPSEQLERLGLA